MHPNFCTGSKDGNVIKSNQLIGLRSRPYDGKIAGLYDLEETLGRGHFAVVKLARHVFTGEKVAVKVIDKSKLDEVSKAHLFQEVRCMKLVQHPNVVRLYEVIDTATKLYLVLELGDGGDLYEYILKHDTGLPEKIAKEYFSQIVRAISYCHQLHVVHRDLKPENVVFFKKQGVVKLTDFGFSNKFYPGQKLETSCGSLAYSAPEILLGDSYDAPAVDVWSLGVILYMLVCGQPPFQEANDSETLTMIMDCKYDIPPHISENCRRLISRMLVRNPDRRSTLAEITKHPWLCNGKQENPDMLPLVSKEQLLEEDHNLIVQKIVNGNIATKEEILECLEKNEYNHITATYYLLAERKLRSKRQDHTNKLKRPEQLSVSQSTQPLEKNHTSAPKPCLLNVPRTPGDLPQRSRKCSIVQEDEEEEDISPCSRQEDLGPPLNRRGSRSEGRLNLAIQERIVESERRKPTENKIEQKIYSYSNKFKNIDKNIQPNIERDSIEADLNHVYTPPIVSGLSDHGTEKCDTIRIPLISNVGSYSYVQLNEIFEEAELLQISDAPSRKFVYRNQPYEQRKIKFHKSRTASCSSSDASDDDSENRKKHTQKLNSSSKSYQSRRDSHDDSSDSQEPGAGPGPSSNANFDANTVSFHANKNSESQKHKARDTNNGRKNSTNTSLMFGRRQKVFKKRNGKTRLRESQSLNRITEVQEDGSQSVVISTTIFSIQGTLSPKVKSIGAKIMKSFNKTIKQSRDDKYLRFDDNIVHISRKESDKLLNSNDAINNSFETPECQKKMEKCAKKNHILGKYFHVQKKICIPLPGIFSKRRIYKAQSCGSLTKKKIFLNSDTLPYMSHNDGHISQNDNSIGRSSSNIVELNSVCSELTEICSIQIGMKAI